jgi:hypothetical protein
VVFLRVRRQKTAGAKIRPREERTNRCRTHGNAIIHSEKRQEGSRPRETPSFTPKKARVFRVQRNAIIRSKKRLGCSEPRGTPSFTLKKG